MVERAATESHGHQGAIEAGNPIIHMFYNGIHAVNERILVVVKAELSIEAKNSCVGAKLASALELWSNKLPKSAELLCLEYTITVSTEIYLAYQSKYRRIYRAHLDKFKPPRSPPLTIGSYVRFYRDRDGVGQDLSGFLT